MAFLTPPETGASISGKPRLASSAAVSRVPTGEEDDMSIRIESLARPEVTPLSPNSTFRTI